MLEGSSATREHEEVAGCGQAIAVPIAGARSIRGDVEMDRSIELLQTEVEELRATVARLRGSGFTGVAPTGTGRR